MKTFNKATTQVALCSVLAVTLSSGCNISECKDRNSGNRAILCNCTSAQKQDTSDNYCCSQTGGACEKKPGVMPGSDSSQLFVTVPLFLVATDRGVGMPLRCEKFQVQWVYRNHMSVPLKPPSGMMVPTLTISEDPTDDVSTPFLPIVTPAPWNEIPACLTGAPCPVDSKIYTKMDGIDPMTRDKAGVFRAILGSLPASAGSPISQFLVSGANPPTCP